MIPKDHTEAVIGHVCMVHGLVGEYSILFQQKLRRSNYVTPKNYLDFINTYSTLLEDKDQYILGEDTAHCSVCVFKRVYKGTELRINATVKLT